MRFKVFQEYIDCIRNKKYKKMIETIDWLESLYDAHKKNPTSLIAQRVRRLKTDNGEIKVVPN